MMNTNLDDRISALMDGELEEGDAVRVILQFKNRGDMCSDWETYHLIGDVLRQRGDIGLSAGFSERLASRLDNEPTVLAPRRLPQKKRTMLAWSAAASIAAVAVVSLATWRFAGEQGAASLASSSGAVATMASNSPKADINAYLAAHQEFSPNAAMQEITPYELATFNTTQDAAR